MAAANAHRVLIASDGSPAADAALAAAGKFPWPAATRGRAVMARFPWLHTESEVAQAALVQSFDRAASATRRALGKRWKDADVIIVEEPPTDAVLAEARRYGATMIVVGWRGHGTFRRLLVGSVSRAVASRAECPVLVVRAAPRAVRRFVVGYDGCANAERAVDLLAGLDPRGCSAVLVNVIDLIPLPATLPRLPRGSRREVVRAAVARRDEHHREAGAMLEPVVARLKRAGWSARYELRDAPPLDALLRASRDWRADVLVVGARSVSGIRRVLLGSVANGVLDRARVPVLIVR